MVAWPPTLPQRVISDGYQELPPDGVLATDMASGPPKTRRLTSVGVRRFRLTIVCTQAQLAILEAFVDDDLAGGVLPIDWVHPRTLAPIVFHFLIEGGRPDYSFVPERGAQYWRVSMGLWATP